MSYWTLAVLMALLAWAPHAPAQSCCTVPDNGTGTADLPTNCPPQGYLGHLQLIDGLPAGSTIEMDARLTDLLITSQIPGGSLGGTIEVFTGVMVLDVTGTGALTGFNRTLNVSVDGETHSAPRTPGAAVQSFEITVHRLKGVLTGDWDFNLLWFEGGDVYLLDSPGHTTLTRQGGPGTDFEVESSFEYNYRIQFEGRQESEWIEQYRGITEDVQSEFDLCSPAATVGVSEDVAPPLMITAAPNPFRSSTQLQFRASAAGLVQVVVFDINGRQVRSLLSAVMPQGPLSLSWDGRNDQGATVPAGVYFTRVTGPYGRSGGRLVKLH